METAHTAVATRPGLMATSPPGTPCVLVLFGACGDLTKRLLMPAFYNLACDGLLPEQFALIGADRSDLSTEQFRARMSDEKDGIKKYNTRKDFNPDVWGRLSSRFYYVNTAPADGYAKLAEQMMPPWRSISSRTL